MLKFLSLCNSKRVDHEVSLDQKEGSGHCSIRTASYFLASIDHERGCELQF